MPSGCCSSSMEMPALRKKSLSAIVANTGLSHPAMSMKL